MEVGVAAPAGDAAEAGVGVAVAVARLVAAEEVFPVVVVVVVVVLLLLLLLALLLGLEEVEMCAVRAPEGVMVVVTIAAGGCFLVFLAPPRVESWSESRVCGDGDGTGRGLEAGEGEGDLRLLLLFIVGLPGTGTARETGLGGSGEVEREVPMPLGPRGGKCAMDWGLGGIAGGAALGLVQGAVRAVPRRHRGALNAVNTKTDGKVLRLLVEPPNLDWATLPNTRQDKTRHGQ